MTKRVFWKKGMRLTDDVLRLSDRYHSEMVEHVFMLAAAGRFGLLPSEKSFQISLDINKNTVEVVSLNCLGITRNGKIIDISFDSRFSQMGDRRAVIPSQAEEKTYFLLVSMTDQWVEVGDATSEPLWKFSLIDEDVPIPDDALPLARIVNDMGWREDEIHFLPPCLLLSSHPRYQQLCDKFREMMAQMEHLVLAKLKTDSGDALKVFWPEVRRLAIIMDKESDVMTPMSLLARIQECIATFHCACTLDEFLGLSESDKYAEYVREPYNFKDCLLKIEEGLSMSHEICQKLENIAIEAPAVQKPTAVTAPWIAETDLHYYATSNNVRFEVHGVEVGVEGYYSIDGGEPDKPLQGGRYVPVNPNFNKTRTVENDRVYVVKLKALKAGRSSSVATFNLTVTKNVNVWSGFQI